jgi:hypothetical protein
MMSPEWHEPIVDAVAHADVSDAVAVVNERLRSAADRLAPTVDPARSTRD